MREVAEKIERHRSFVAFTCDRCQKHVTEDDMVEWQEFEAITKTGGYGALIGDGSHVQVDFCQACFIEVLRPWLRWVDDDGVALPPRTGG